MYPAAERIRPARKKTARPPARASAYEAAPKEGDPVGRACKGTVEETTGHRLLEASDQRGQAKRHPMRVALQRVWAQIGPVWAGYLG